MDTQAVITDWKGVLVHCGLGKPWKRALCVGLTAGAVSYALKVPRRSYDQRGRATPNFFLVPLTTAALVYCLT